MPGLQTHLPTDPKIPKFRDSHSGIYCIKPELKLCRGRQAGLNRDMSLLSDTVQH